VSTHRAQLIRVGGPADGTEGDPLDALVDAGLAVRTPEAVRTLEDGAPGAVIEERDGWEMYVAGEAGSPTRCPRCGTAAFFEEHELELMDIETYEGLDESETMLEIDAGEAWFRGRVEPLLLCRGCGWSAPWGDWDVRGAAVPSWTALVFESGGRVDPDRQEQQMVEALRAGTGARWVGIHLMV
jgi:hypothetical protein